MRNIHPLVVRPEVAADLNAAVASAEQSRHPSGFGWTTVHVVKPPSTSYVEAGLMIADAAMALKSVMPRVRRFYATIGSAIDQATRDPLGSYEDDTCCFGFGPHCYLKLDIEGKYIRRIWFDLRSDAPEHASALRQSLEAVHRLVPSFIADYFMEIAVPLSDAELLDRYFAQRKAEIEHAAQWLEKWQREQE